jgi:replicative DNA helicase
MTAGAATAPLRLIEGGLSLNVPPQNLDAEESVLGCMLQSRSAIEACAALDPDDFYRESHARIFRAILSLFEQGEPADAITVQAELERTGRNGIPSVRLHELSALLPASSNAAHYAKLVAEAATRRRLKEASLEVIRAVDRGGDVQELVEQAQQSMLDMSAGYAGSEFVPVSDVMQESHRRLSALYEANGGLVGLSSGFRRLDIYTCGFQSGQLILVAARPGMGKSAFAFCLARNIAAAGTTVGLVTLEMSSQEFAQRLIAIEANVPHQKIRNPGDKFRGLTPQEWQKVTNATATLAQLPIQIDDAAGESIAELRTKVRRLKTRFPDLGLVIVDYIQLLGHSVENRTQEVGLISRSLKLMARDLDVPVIALSQLNRGVEARADKRPLLADLRDSGSLEQDGDVILFLYRDDYYYEGSDTGVCEVNVAKQRNGPTGTIKLAWLKEQARFSELA